MTMQVSVAVVGGGIIGLSIAVRLQRRGLQVLLLDAAEPCRGASWGNAGHIATEQVYPVADASLLPKLPAMLLGSTTTGMAAARVRPGVIDDLVLFGSPGAGVQEAEELNVPQGHAWVSGVEDGDAVLGRGPDWDFGPNPMGMDGFTHLSNEAPDPRSGLWSWNPFGRHSVYLAPDSGTLKDFGKVVAGVR